MVGLDLLQALLLLRTLCFLFNVNRVRNVWQIDNIEIF